MNEVISYCVPPEAVMMFLLEGGTRSASPMASSESGTDCCLVRSGDAVSALCLTIAAATGAGRMVLAVLARPHGGSGKTLSEKRLGDGASVLDERRLSPPAHPGPARRRGGAPSRAPTGAGPRVPAPPGRTARTTPSSTSRGVTRTHTPPGPVVDCPPRPNGSMRPAAASRAPGSPGVTSCSPGASTAATSGRASSLSGTTVRTAGPEPRRS